MKGDYQKQIINKKTLKLLRNAQKFESEEGEGGGGGVVNQKV